MMEDMCADLRSEGALFCVRREGISIWMRRNEGNSGIVREGIGPSPRN
jgi:hypothetical protein